MIIGTSSISRDGKCCSSLDWLYALSTWQVVFLLSFLPPVIHITKTSSATLHWLIGKLHSERMQVLPGTDIAGQHLVELVMLEALRYAIATSGNETTGLLRALSDTKIRKVLDAIHSDVAKA